MPLTFEQLRDANVRRCEEVYHPVDEWSPTDWATACAGEMGEALNLIKKARRISVHPGEWPRDAHHDIGDELADTVIYIDLLCARLGLDLADCIRQKFNRTSEDVGSSVGLLELNG